MKTTVMDVDLCIKPEGEESSVMEEVKAALLQIDGVSGIDWRREGYKVVMNITINFASSDGFHAIDRKIFRYLNPLTSVVVSGRSRILTDIYGAD
ncbi:MAG: hypothetical protein GC159_07730 [Phycisphaera sp.]|nr:hypothetical protein [Phycisphaera sp.]